MKEFKKFVTESTQWISLAGLVFGLAAIVLSLGGWTTSSQFAFVDNSVLLQNFKDAKAAREKIEAKRQEWTKNAKALEDSVSVVNKELVEFGKSMSKAELKRKTALLETKQQDYLRYVRAVSEKSTKMEKDEMQPIFDELNARIKEYAKTKRYALVFGTVAGGNILYGSDAVDITQEFIDFANHK
jgi:Skp family chaperone for outer membrane proteins